MQRNMNPKMMFSISLIALISGCGGSDDGNNNSLVPDNELIISEDETNTTELEGTWLKSCSAVDENDPDTLYDIVEATFNNNKFNSSIYNYIDSHCTTALSFSPNPTSSGVFSLGGQIITSGGVESTIIDTHIDTFDGAPFIIDEFSIYYLDNNTLYFGNDNNANDGLSEATRPDTINYDRIFIRQ
jgi:hypothetical protein